jgi:hypothetical protein
MADNEYILFDSEENNILKKNDGPITASVKLKICSISSFAKEIISKDVLTLVIVRLIILDTIR